MKKTVYVITGVSGSGKSWVVNNLKTSCLKANADKEDISIILSNFRSSPENKLILELTATVSTIIKKMSAEFNVVPIYVVGDFLHVKQQLIGRGGQVSRALYARWKRFNTLKRKYPGYSGSSDSVLKYIRQRLINVNSIYMAISPSNKSYIGQTSRGLTARRASHEYETTSKVNKSNKLLSFHGALHKYGYENFEWKILKDQLSPEAANYWEKYYISRYKTNDSNYGYNLTSGGKELFAHSPETKKIIANKVAASSMESWKNPERRKKAAETTAAMWKDSATKKLLSAKIKVSRSSSKQRALTSADSTARYADASKRVDMAVACGGRQFKVINAADGTEIGEWINAAQCAKDLGLVTKTHISNCLHGRRKTYGGFKFVYSETTNIQTEESNETK
jgi:group I intron endonuclease